MGNFGFKNVSKRDKIDLMEYLCYGLGDFSFCFIYGAIGSYIVFFYTDVACISAATVGTVLLVSKIFDGISDMMMGYIIENVHSPLGKARPWLLWMSIPFALSAVLLEESLLLPHPTAETASTAASARLTNFFIIVSSSILSFL